MADHGSVDARRCGPYRRAIESFLSKPFYSIFAEADKEQLIAEHDCFRPRVDIIAILRSRPRCDVLVVGGGIHGAALARLAAFNGLRTVLLEREDYGWATSSRSSKMAHGGLRYLELLDFPQVFAGIRAREELFQSAPHLAGSHPFFVPLQRRFRGQSIKLGLGLTLYDLMARVRGPRRHCWWRPAADGIDPALLPRPEGYRYFDGLMQDARLVIEEILAARQEGALCLNHATVKSLHQRSGGEVSVGWLDNLSGEQYELVAGIVINCAGPWVAQVGRITAGPLAGRIRLSRGIHLLFDRPWNGPALCLPLGARGRYYFVWPFNGVTMVGTTEREVHEIEDDPLPRPDEVSELLGFLARDLPGAGLTKERLYYAFAGLRTLAVGSTKKSTNRLSRRHVWHYADGMLSLIGGKFTTARATAFEGLKRVADLAALPKPARLDGQAMPGALFLHERTTEFRRFAESRNVPRAIIDATIRRLGGRAILLRDRDLSMHVVGGCVLEGEIELAFGEEQAESLDDLLRRRLLLEYFPGHALDALAEIGAVISRLRPGIDLVGQERRYRARIESLQTLLD